MRRDETRAHALRRKTTLHASIADDARRLRRPLTTRATREADGRVARRLSRARGAPSTPDAWTQKTTIQVFVEGRDWSFRGLTLVEEDGGEREETTEGREETTVCAKRLLIITRRRRRAED